jgi:hypothetical protein
MIKNLPRKLILHAGILMDNLVTPHEKRVRRFTGRPYLFSLLTLPFFLAANYLFNHQRLWLSFLPEGRPMYFFTVILPFGILLPSLTLGWLIREADGEAHIFGATLKYRDLKMMAFAFAAGIVITFIPVGWRILGDISLIGTSIHLFIWLFMVSLAEVLMFIGVVFNTALWLALKWFPGRNRLFERTAVAVALSALAYALFHFTYPDPWNSWSIVAMLVPVGLMVSLAYVFTRSLAATVVFTNVLSVAGYLLTDSLLTGSDILGMVLNAIVVFAVVIILMLVGIYDEEF